MISKTPLAQQKKESESNIVSLLGRYQMLSQLQREMIIDDAIASITCTSKEHADAYQQFAIRNRLATEADLQTWLKQHNLTQMELVETITRNLKIEKFKRATWGDRLKAYFLSHQKRLDKVVYSLIRTKDMGIAQELYFRIVEEEQSFSDLARDYSQGLEAHTNGLLGPFELGCINPQIARLLNVSQIGQVWGPICVEGWWMIIRLEKFLPACFDEVMSQRLDRELFETWLCEQHNRLREQGMLLQQLRDGF
jgi:parvulin-like peptidyl-prolyl isomerase